MRHKRDTPLPAARAKGDDQFRLLVEQVKDYAIFSLDPSGIVSSWNAGAERIKGYRADEIVGHHFSRFYPEEAIRSGWPQTELELAARDGRFEDEGWRVRKDGSRFWANVVITALREDGELRGFAKITRDLTDKRRAERLEADAQQVSQFVAMLAHELRNPLAPIRNGVALAKRQQNPERTTWALDVIERQAAHMSRLVDDLLDMSRVTRGLVRIERRRVAVREIVGTAIDAISGEAERRGHRIRTDFRDEAIVRGDVVRLTQVLTNLLGNACKYTPPGGLIDVEVESRDDRAEIRVRDNGIGISPHLLPRLFDVFTQEDRSLDRAEGGLGLGLAISSRLVELHGGELTAHSAGPGCGSEFLLRLPLLSTSTAEAAEPQRLSVLVVDDNVDAAQTLEALLEAHGHRALVAFDGETGLKLARENVPDVILLDIGLPGMNGYEVARAIRGTPALQGVVLAAVTGYGTDEDRREAVDAGFDVHLSKPVDYVTLCQRIALLAT